MSNINTVAITGNLTRDPELRQTQGGTSVCKLGIAVNERVKRGEEWVEEASFFNVTVFGRQGENVASYLSKGRPVAIQGKLRSSSYEKNGEKRTGVEIIADQVQFLSSSQSQQGGSPNGQAEVQPAGVGAGSGTDEDDLPF